MSVGKREEYDLPVRSKGEGALKNSESLRRIAVTKKIRTIEKKRAYIVRVFLKTLLCFFNGASYKLIPVYLGDFLMSRDLRRKTHQLFSRLRVNGTALCKGFLEIRVVFLKRVMGCDGLQKIIIRPCHGNIEKIKNNDESSKRRTGYDLFGENLFCFVQGERPLHAREPRSKAVEVFSFVGVISFCVYERNDRSEQKVACDIVESKKILEKVCAEKPDKKSFSNRKFFDCMLPRRKHG